MWHHCVALFCLFVSGLSIAPADGLRLQSASVLIIIRRRSLLCDVPVRLWSLSNHSSTPRPPSTTCVPEKKRAKSQEPTTGQDKHRRTRHMEHICIPAPPQSRTDGITPRFLLLKLNVKSIIFSLWMPDLLIRTRKTTATTATQRGVCVCVTCFPHLGEQVRGFRPHFCVLGGGPLQALSWD